MRVPVRLLPVLLLCCAFPLLPAPASAQQPLSCDSLNRLSSEAQASGQFNLALQRAKEALIACDTQSEGYLDALSNQANAYNYLGRPKEAMASISEALRRQMARPGGDRHKNYAVLLLNTGGILTDIGKYQEALDTFRHCVRVFESLGLTLDADYGQALIFLGINHTYLGQYEKAGIAYARALAVADSLGELGKDLYWDVLQNNAANLEASGEYDKALPIYIKIEKDKPHDYLYASAMNNLANLYLNMGMVKEAERATSIALEYNEKFFGKENYRRCFIFMNLVEIYSRQGNDLAADSLMQETKILIEKVVGKEHALYGFALNNLASFAQKRKDYILADSLINESLSVIEKVSGKKTPEYANVLELLGDNYRGLKLPVPADSIYREVLHLLSDSLGLLGLQYSRVLDKVANLLDEQGHASEAFPFYQEATQVYLDNLYRDFGVISEQGQEQMLHQIEPNIQKMASFCLKSNKPIPQTATMAFDLALGLKQTRLESARSVRRAIERNPGDNSTDLGQVFERWRELRALIAQQARIPVQQRSYPLDSLITAATRLEPELAQKSLAFRNAFSRTNWKDLRDSLYQGEAALEFFNFRYCRGDVQTDSIIYCALLLKKEYDFPKMIFLFEEKQLKSWLNFKDISTQRTIESLYTGPQSPLYNLIWKPIEPFLKEDETVYYAPSGLLNSVALSAVQSSNRYLAQKYRLRCVGSTRSLLARTELKAREIGSGLVYGGIQYVADTQTMAIAVGAVRKMRSGNALGPLPSSEIEANAIARICQRQNIRTWLLTGVFANEESIKLFGSLPPAPDFIHFSSHALTESPDSAELDHSLPAYRVSQDPLLNAMIVLANGDRALNGKPVEGYEDGLLTAYEIIPLDLSNTKLGVLAACSTGLGDVKGAEGVFGLQRAFRLAGVRRLLVSLWEVSDAETADFMESFYKNWLTKNKDTSVSEAFQKTQQQMRKKYKSPYFWAGWVLIE